MEEQKDAGLKREPWQRDNYGFTSAMRLQNAMNFSRLQRGWFEGTCPECGTKMSLAVLIETHFAPCLDRALQKEKRSL